MKFSKVIITKQNELNSEYSLENEVGLSTYDLALISFSKTINKNKSYIQDDKKNTFLI